MKKIIPFLKPYRAQLLLAVLLSVGLFIVLPSLAEKGILSLGASGTVATLIGGLTKVLILIAYMIFCGMVPDVRRTFQYHGAEHKTVYCHEHNLPLTPKNAQQFTTLHPRCGTSFCYSSSDATSPTPPCGCWCTCACCRSWRA